MLIYKIITPHSPKCYVGKTITKLRERLRGHESKFRQWDRMTEGWCSSYGLLWLGDCTIELLEETADKFAEARWIRKLDSVNVTRPAVSMDERKACRDAYRQARKEQSYCDRCGCGILATDSSSMRKHKESDRCKRRTDAKRNNEPVGWKARRLVMIPCDRCGIMGAACSIHRHQRSARCIRLTAEKGNT